MLYVVPSGSTWGWAVAPLTAMNLLQSTWTQWFPQFSFSFFSIQTYFIYFLKIIISMYLFFCFKCLWINFVHEVGLCADIVVSFILNKAYICIVSWLCGKRESSHTQNIFRPLQSEPKMSHSLGSSNRERKRWKKFLHGSGIATVPNSDTIIRLCSRFAL